MSRRRHHIQPVPLWVLFLQCGVTILASAAVVAFMLLLIPEVLRLLAPILLVL